MITFILFISLVHMQIIHEVNDLISLRIIAIISVDYTGCFQTDGIVQLPQFLLKVTNALS